MCHVDEFSYNFKILEFNFVLSTLGSKYRRIEAAHSQADIIENRLTYSCVACSKSFGREAALKRHIEYDHTKQYLDSDEEDEDDYKDFEDTEAGNASGEDEFQPPIYRAKHPRY